MTMQTPARDEFLGGCKKFEENEYRDSMYKVATFLLSYFWGKPAEMADALGVLLLTWNQAFYRYGEFDFDRLEEWISKNLRVIEGFRNREILSLGGPDESEIKTLFRQLLSVLQIDSGKMRGRKSPVAVSKALHLLAPRFFPLWDTKIARAYRCYYDWRPADRYFEFCRLIKDVAGQVKGWVQTRDKTLVKLIDEYNYAKYTGRWI